MANKNKPIILAPAGDQNSFMAAIAAGADAVYCGLKIFSARMEAKNFSMEELSRLNALARSHNVQLHVAMNSLVKQHELERTAGIIGKLVKYVKPHALILQDPGLADLALTCGFKGELHLSTLSNCTFPLALDMAGKAGFNRVVLPRELTIDEIKMMAASAPDNVDLETFIHGALCYAVSGRCYWSSWFGGRSGLRGRCVQPCRRLYKQQNERERYFSCLDFSADVLVKVLKDIPKVTTWKIEGRKKSPHYVFYTVKAYKMLRDQGHDPSKKKIALSFLEYAMGRPTTHYNLLSQRPQNPLKKDEETGSGLFIGRVKHGDAPHVITREALLKDDLLRIGYEDDRFHAVQRVNRPIPKKGKLVLGTKSNKGGAKKNGEKRSGRGKEKTKSPRVSFKKGTPVFIVDRREKEVWDLIAELTDQLQRYRSPEIKSQETDVIFADVDVGEKAIASPISPTTRLTLHGLGNEAKLKTKTSAGGKKSRKSDKKGLWLSQTSLKRCAPSKVKEVWWVLPPVVWPEDQSKFLSVLGDVLSLGANNFVLNMPWQITCFDALKSAVEDIGEFSEKQSLSKPSGSSKQTSKRSTLNLWAGPFCNIANHAYLQFLKNIGFSGAFVSPELGKEDFFSLPKDSPLPLGMLMGGLWPLAISRTISEDIILDQCFESPREERTWVSKRESDYWIYPNWHLDLKQYQPELADAGYALFLDIDEPLPRDIEMKKRPGLWNWDLKLL